MGASAGDPRSCGWFFGSRIIEHPILEFDYANRRKVKFSLDGRELEGLEGEPIAASLVASGVRVFRYSPKLERPRGFFCAVGRCSSCLMTVNGIPNVRTCVTPLAEGMVITTQRGKGVLGAVTRLLGVRGSSGREAGPNLERGGSACAGRT